MSLGRYCATTPPHGRDVFTLADLREFVRLADGEGFADDSILHGPEWMPKLLRPRMWLTEPPSDQETREEFKP